MIARHRCAGRHTRAAAVIIGACLALSSTAIVIEVLSDQRRLSTTAGRTSFSILLAQDLAVVPILLLVSILGAGAGGSVLTGLVLALGQRRAGARRHRHRRPAAAAAAVPAGRRHRPSELFVAATLFVIVGSGVAAGLAGLSMALGAFVAGLLLAETEFRKAIETTIEPFKGLLLGLFFFTVGMNIDFRELAREPFWLLASRGRPDRHQGRSDRRPRPMFRVPLAGGDRDRPAARPGRRVRLRRHRRGDGAPAGRRPTAASFTLAVTSLTMALIPLLAMRHGASAPAEERKPLDPDWPRRRRPAAKGTPSWSGTAGSDRSSATCSSGTASVPRHRQRSGGRRGASAARARGLLRRCRQPGVPEELRLMEAAAVIVTIHDQAAIDEIVAACARSVPTSSSSRAPAMPLTRAISTPLASPTRCPRPSRRACSFRRRRWSGSALPPGRSSPRSTRSATSSATSCRRRPAPAEARPARSGPGREVVRAGASALSGRY